jgi:hypothetical protein
MHDFEVIVIDDGSTDGGGEIIREMTDPRIRLIVQENAGVAAARNRGIHEALSESIAFLDADDEWEPCFLETVAGLRDRYPDAGIYATAYRYFKAETSWRPRFLHCIERPQGGLLEDYFRAATAQPPVWTSAVMIPKRVFGEVGGFPVGVKTGEDRHMWARIALRYHVAWSPVEGAVYHLSADNRACVVSPLASDVAEAGPIEEFLRSDREPLSPRRSVREYLALRRLSLALECHLSGQTPWAMALIEKTSGTSKYRLKRLWFRWAFRISPQMLIRMRKWKALVASTGR